ncbi:MAG: asparagine synthase (glutamine-hydrolyzing) [Saccharospirillum sp.]
MCGIVGIVSLDKNKISEREKTRIEEAMEAMKTRGPDMASIYHDDRVIVGHVRLSILDIKGDGSLQPIKDRSAVLAYNGEIYNWNDGYVSFKERKKYQDIKSDTQYLWEGLRKDGIQFCEKLNGMYAFFYYDRLAGKVYLVRDKYGIKPIFYIIKNGFLFFASTLISLKIIADDLTFSRVTISESLKYGFPLDENSFYEDVFLLRPGSYIESCLNYNLIKSVTYFEIGLSSKQKPKIISKKNIEQKIYGAIDCSVKRQLISDVPVGLFLSGGIDSNVIAYHARKYEPKIKTYTAVFDGQLSEDAKTAIESARKLDLEHELIDISLTDVIKDLTTIVRSSGYPLLDYAALPLFLMAKKVREDNIKVVLQGDGGDELFGGYDRYRYLKLSEKMKTLMPLIRVLNKKQRGIKGKRLERFICNLSLMDKSDRAFSFLSMINDDVIDKIFISKIGKSNASNLFYNNNLRNFARYYENLSASEVMNLIDWKVTLPNSFFLKVDFSTMASSIEARVPFLDDNVVALARQLNFNEGIGIISGKKVLRNIYKKKILGEVFKGKRGFTVPVRNWFLTDLSDYLLALAKKSDISEIIDFNYLKVLVFEHRNSISDNSLLLWRILVLCIWWNSNTHSKSKGSCID